MKSLINSDLFMFNNTLIASPPFRAFGALYEDAFLAVRGLLINVLLVPFLIYYFD